MKKEARVFVVCGALAACGVAAGGIETEIVDFFPEGEQLLQSQLLFIRPHLAGREIVETRLIIEFTPAAGYNAADFYLLLVAPVEPVKGATGFVYLQSGKDLGWHGSGTFSASLSFSDLNGILMEGGRWGFEAFPSIDPPIFAGTFSDSTRWEIDTVEVPAPGALALLASGALCGARRRRRQR